MKYSLETCNIKDCKTPQHGLLLCKRHFDQYITNERIYKIQLNVMLDNFTPITIKSFFRLLFYNFYHYFGVIRVLYVEHFPLESLFHYWYVFGRIRKNPNVTPVQFIEDFDYDENIKIGSLKTHFKTHNSTEKIKSFSETIYGKLSLKFYIFFFLCCLLSFVVLFLKFGKFSTYNIGVTTVLCTFIVFPITILGINLINSYKKIYAEAIDNKLFKNWKHNDKFIKNSQTLINRIHWNKERMMTLGPFLLLVPIFVHRLLIPPESSWDFISISTIVVISVLVMTLILGHILYMNFFLLPGIMRFENWPLKISLYNLDRNFGWETIKNFWRVYTLYNISIVITILTFTIIFAESRYKIVALPVIFFLGGSFSSLPFIVKFYFRLKKQFDQEVKLEKIKLEKTSTASRIEKYDFIEKLKFSFLQLSVLKDFGKYCLPFLISYVIDLYSTEIQLFLKLYFNFIK